MQYQNQHHNYDNSRNDHLETQDRQSYENRNHRGNSRCQSGSNYQNQNRQPYGEHQPYNIYNNSLVQEARSLNTFYFSQTGEKEVLEHSPST